MLLGREFIGVGSSRGACHAHRRCVELGGGGARMAWGKEASSGGSGGGGGFRATRGAAGAAGRRGNRRWRREPTAAPLFFSKPRKKKEGRGGFVIFQNSRG